MKTTTVFYWAMGIAITGLLANASIRDIAIENRRENALLGNFQTFSYDQLAVSYKEFLAELQHKPKTAKEYYTVLGHGYAIIGSAKKAMLHPPATWSDRTGRDFRVDDIVRSIPVKGQFAIDQYAQNLADLGGTPEQEKALREFEASGLDPLIPPKVVVPGDGHMLKWWYWFHFGSMPFVFIHFAIQLRRRGLKVFHDVAGNPMFPFWLLFWEIGVWKYPMKVSPTEQLRRAQRWATLVLSSTLYCFAGTGKVCEKSERAPQHQKYDGLWSPFSFSTATWSNYTGLDGGIFFPGVVQQSTATVALPCGVYLNLFYSEPLDKRNLRPNFGREMDYAAGWSRTFRNYSVDVSGTYINVFPLTKMPRGDVLQFNERVTRKIQLGNRTSIAPYLLLREAVPARGPTPVGGTFVHGGATLSRTFNDRVSASLTAEALHDPGAFGYRPGYLSRMIASVNWKGNRGISMQFPQVVFTDPLSHTADGRGVNLSFGIGFSFSPAH